MKTRCSLPLFATLLLFVNGTFVHCARAADSDVAITVEKKQVADASPGTGMHADSNEAKKTQHWGFTVTIENQGFKALQNLDAKYIIFYKKEELGQKGAHKESKTGEQKVDPVQSLGKTTFQTTDVELTRSSLVGTGDTYFYFTNGAKPTSADTLTGIWIRLYSSDGKLFAEYAYPAGLTSSEQWQDK
jgi:hypothetical protein